LAIARSSAKMKKKSRKYYSKLKVPLHRAANCTGNEKRQSRLIFLKVGPINTS